MVFHRNRVYGSVRRWAAGFLLCGSTLAAAGCSLLPTPDDIRSATTTVKDTVTGKARKDKLNKTYAEARILERRKDYVAAERLYRELLTAEPKSRDCYHRLGVMAAVQGKYPEAHMNYQAALKCSQPTPDLLSDIGYCHYLQNQLPLAEQALRSAVALDPTHAAATNNLALVVGEQGNLDEAYDLFRKVNREAEAECNFAYLCAQCGDLPNAQAHFSRALTANPDMKPAAQALLQVTSALQRKQDEARARLAELAAQGNQPQAPGAPSAGAQAGVVQASAQQPLAPQYAGPQHAAPQYAGLQPGTQPYGNQQYSAQQSANPQYAVQASPIAQAGYAPPTMSNSAVVQAGGYAPSGTFLGGGVQQASANVDPATADRAAQILAAAPQQRLIEVYRGAPRTAAGSAQIAATHAAEQSAAADAAAQSGAGAPNVPSPAAGWGNVLAGGSATQNAGPSGFPPSTGPAPFSFPSSASPQYLQPSLQSRQPTNDASGNSVGAAPNNSAAVTPVASGRQNGRLLPAAARPSVLSFPQSN